MKTTNAVLLAIAGCFVTVVVACTVVYTVDSQGATDFITPVLGFTGTTLALVAGLAQINRKQAEQQAQLDDVKRDVGYLANGGMDAKARAAIGDVVREELLKPEAKAQLEQDRAYRDAGPSGAQADEGSAS